MNFNQMNFNQLKNNPNQIHALLQSLGISYPISKDEIVEQAQAASVDNQIIERLRRLPNQKYQGPGELVEALVKLK